MEVNLFEFEVNGKRYRARPIEGRAQFHMVRRLAPVLGSLKDLIAVVPDPIAAFGPTTSNAEKVKTLTNMMEAAGPFLEAMSKMSDEDADYILDRCLKVTWRVDESGGAQPMWNAASRKVMFDDLTMIEMLSIAWNVIQGSASLMGFSNELLSPSIAA